jgi:hypothetical protein
MILRADEHGRNDLLSRIITFLAQLDQ